MSALPHPNHHRILVVEEDPRTRDSLAARLAEMGHWVESVPDTAATLERSRQNGFDVLLTSIWQPEAADRNLLGELAARGQLPARIVCMGIAPVEQTLTRSRQAGCHVYLAKPFGPAELEAALQ